MIIKHLKENIDKQIDSNRGKNLFYSDAGDSLKFTIETESIIEKIGEIDEDSENTLIEYTTNRALEEFCRINQYYNINQSAKLSLKLIYKELYNNIRLKKASANAISKLHYNNLKKWLRESNPFAEIVYSPNDEMAESVPCSQYSAALQIEILAIDTAVMEEPVLDIGCGKEGNLVVYLRNLGIEAYGIDRFVCENEFLINSDWLEYNFNSKSWGTITSNLGFTNHFVHHHYRNDGCYIDYAKKYIEILNSLKVGGSFHYAPGLLFVEQFVDKNKYSVKSRNIQNLDFKSTVIKRLE